MVSRGYREGGPNISSSTSKLSLETTLLESSVSQLIGPSSQATAQYILRVPRFKSPQLDREVAVVEYVNQNYTIPATLGHSYRFHK